jgi:hypothetical protein
MIRVRVEEPAVGLIAGAIKSHGARLSAQKADTIGRRAVIIGYQIADKELRTRVPDRRGDRKGSTHYKNAFTTRRSGSTFPIRTDFGNNSDIANIIEGGSKAHVIRGNPKLKFPGQAGDPGLPSSFGSSRFTYAKSVNHPGTRAYKIVERALLQALREQGINVRGTT